jgi:hypothetical protein
MAKNDVNEVSQVTGVRRLTLSPGLLARPWTVSSANVGARGFRKVWRGPVLGPVFTASAPGLHFQPQLLAKLDGSLIRQNGRSAECDARAELVPCMHCNGSQFPLAVLCL